MTPEFRPLSRQYNDQLVALFRASPIVADFTICFDRHPDFFRFPDLVFDSYTYQGIFHGERMIGCVMHALLTGWLGPEREYGTYCYMGDARVEPAVRGGHTSVEAALGLLRDHAGDAPIALGLIKEGNLPASHLAESLEPDDFEFRKLARFEAANIILLRRTRPDLSTRVRRATLHDIPEMAEVMQRAFRGRLFAPRITAESLARDVEHMPGLGIEQYYLAERHGRMVGVLGAWDMGAFKRTLILRYSAMARALKAAYRAGRVIFRRAAPLPRSGEPLREVSITRMAVPGRDPAVLRDLLAAAANDCLERRYHMMHVGFAGPDRLRAATRSFLVQRFCSTLWVGWPSDSAGAELVRAADPYVDISMI